MLRGHNRPINSLAFSPDGTTLLSFDNSDALRVWNLMTGSLRWEASEEKYSAAAVTPDGKFVVTCAMAGDSEFDWLSDRRRRPFNREHPIQYREVKTGAASPAPFMPPSERGVYGFQFSPGGSRCVARDGLVGRDLYWWVYPSGERLPAWISPDEIEFGYSGAAEFSPDGRNMSLLNDHINLYEVETGHCFLRERIRRINTESFVAFHPLGRQLAIASGKRMALFDIESRREVVTFSLDKKYFLGLAFTPDGRFLATVSNEGTVKLWDVSSGRLATEYALDAGGLRCVAISPDGLTAAAGGTGKRIVVWDLDE